VNRPRVTVHNTVSLDGQLTVDVRQVRDSHLRLRYTVAARDG